MRDYTIVGMLSYTDFDSNREYLQKPLVIYTRVFNKRLWLSPNAYACFIADCKTSTDGASLPNLAVRLTGISPRSKIIRLPWVWHDHLYQIEPIEFFVFDKVENQVGKSLGTHKITRNEADQFMRDKMKHMGASMLDRNIVYYGLKIWGQRAWNMYRS